MRPICFAILMIVAVPAVPRAWASQAPGAPVVDPSLALGSTTAGEADTERDAGTTEDPHGDRAVLLPTALTQPAGTVSISSYDLFFAGLTFGLTDHLQLSTTALLTPFLGSTVVVGNVKWQLVRHGAFRLSLNGGMSYARIESDESVHGPDGQARFAHRLLPHLGAAASYCLTDDCQSLVSASVQFLTGSDRWQPVQSTSYFGASLIHRLSEHTKLVAEVTSAAELHPNPTAAGGALSTLALRYFNHHVALDGGIMAVAATGGELLPLPYFAGSFRF
jgi:hypothetical protein